MNLDHVLNWADESNLNGTFYNVQTSPNQWQLHSPYIDIKVLVRDHFDPFQLEDYRSLFLKLSPNIAVATEILHTTMAELTPDIIAKREANKQRAIDKLRAARERLAAAKGGSSSNSSKANSSSVNSSNSSTNAGTFNVNGKRPAETTPGPGPGPSQHRKANNPTQRRDYSSRLTENYIEFDFSKMKDSKGGFISDEAAVKSKEEQMKEEWKQQEKLRRGRKY